MSNYEMLMAIFAGITLVIQIVKLRDENKKSNNLQSCG